MSEPLPIREGITPAVDVEREMLDFAMTQIRLFKESAGRPPTRVALVFMGKGDDNAFHSRVRSWDSREEHCRAENAGTAAALLLRYATKGD